MNEWLVLGIGLSSQALFSARLLVQWIRSERAKRVLSPVLFWQLSLIASFLMMVYGVLRLDPVIILGQTFSYFIYIRNLRFKRAWRYIPLYFRLMVLTFPLITILWFFGADQYGITYILEQNQIGNQLLSWGLVGQSIFTLRFVYQWVVSEQQKKSVLPAGFWIISLTGSAMMLGYAILRWDAALLLGHVFGSVVYSRNLILWFRTKRSKGN